MGTSKWTNVKYSKGYVMHKALHAQVLDSITYTAPKASVHYVLYTQPIKVNSETRAVMLPTHDGTHTRT
jgi:hypothetical protein